ncbi:MAG: hypothetical protein K8R06_04610, partial [Methanosarcinales archaeon]|nr:hypothetical protein [Methanosarcinales archaeon]
MNQDKGLSKEEIIQKVVKGEMKLHAIDQFVDTREAVDIRREAAVRMTGTELDNVGRFSIDETEAAKR